MSLTELIVRSTAYPQSPPDGYARLIALTYALLAAATSTVPLDEVRFAQLTIQRRVVIRVPTLVPLPQRRLRWVEKKGPKCVPMNALAGAAITSPDSVDLYMRGGRKLRAKLEDRCPAIDFFPSFYIRPTPDGSICANRDVIHSRAGGQCSIEKFRTLVPER